MNKSYILIAIVFCICACSSQTGKSVDIDILSAKQMISQNKNITMLDVRTQKERDLGAIESSKHLDYFSDDFDEKLKTLDMSKKYIVYCKSGGRSSKTVAKLQDLGYIDVFNMLGGYEAWSKSAE